MVDARLDPFWKLPLRLGLLLAAPRAALQRIDARGGGFRDGVLLTLVGLVAFRFQQVTESVLALREAGGLGHLISFWAKELNDAALVVIPAAVALTALGGRRRDPAQDLELASACYTPYFAVRAVARAVNAVVGFTVVPDLVSLIPAVGAALWVAVQALLVIRARAPRVEAAGPESSAVADDAGDAQPAAEAPPPSPLPRSARGAALALLAVVGVGLGGNAVWAARRIEVLKPMHRGQAAPEFSLRRIDGAPGVVAMSSLRGKVVLLDFWATWCPPCLQMIPVMDQLHHDWNARGVEFLGVNSDGGQTSEDQIRAFLRQHPSPYPMVIDDEGQANAAYRIRALPQFVLISRDGTLLRSFIGLTSRDELGTALEKALGMP